MTSAHVRPVAFNVAEAICAAVARSPACAEPNMPAMRARRSTVAMSATGLLFLRRLDFGLILVDPRFPAARHDEIPCCSRENCWLGFEDLRLVLGPR
jgi:hypothetical protein